MKRYAYIKAGDVITELQETITWKGPPPDGGPKAYTYYFVRYLTEGKKSVILSHWPTDKKKIFSHKNITAKNLTGHHTSLVAQFGLLKSLFAFRPDLLLCSMYDLNLLSVAIAAFFLRSPYIICCHNRIIEKKRSFSNLIKRSLNRVLFKKARAVICHGPYLFNKAKEIGVPEKKIIEFNWRIDYLNNKGKADYIGDLTDGGTKKVVLFIGRVTRSKGVFDLLNALEDRIINKNDIHLVYAGDGEELYRLRKFASIYPNRISCLGNVEHESLGSVYSQAHVVVTPTHSSFPEGLCKVINEGFIFGKPVIGPRFGPFPYLIRDGINGLLYEADSVKDLESKLSAILDNFELYSQLVSGSRESGQKVKLFEVDFAEAIKHVLSWISCDE